MFRYDISAHDSYLRAELLDRETAEQTSEFLRAAGSAARAHRSTRVLICVHSSRPIFKVEQYNASAYLKEIAARPWLRVALVSSRHDLRSAHEYVEVLARQQGAALRSFADDASAIAWLREEKKVTA